MVIYETIDEICTYILNNLPMCKFEKRPSKYMFGVNNYGEITNTINPSDGDPWDIVVPGYPPLDINVPYKIRKLEGVIIMPNGNHKLIVDVDTDLFRKTKKDCTDEIFTYRRLYNKICKKNGFIQFY